MCQDWLVGFSLFGVSRVFTLPLLFLPLDHTDFVHWPITYIEDLYLRSYTMEFHNNRIHLTKCKHILVALQSLVIIQVYLMMCLSSEVFYFLNPLFLFSKTKTSCFKSSGVRNITSKNMYNTISLKGTFHLKEKSQVLQR